MTQKNIRSVARLYLRMILLWIAAMMLFMFIRNYGVDKAGLEKVIRELGPRELLLMCTAIGTMAGTVFATVELIFERPYFQKHSYSWILAGKLLFFFFTVKIMMAFGITLATTLNGASGDTQDAMRMLQSKTYWVLFVYFVLAAALFSFVGMVSQKFGPGVLWNMFIGKYRNPREELRVFMFLDLKASTTIAEKLGHIKFSQLIQNCFADLTPVITRHKVQIYQYVGDEAVLSWSLENGFEDNHCIHSYFDFMDVLEARAEDYLRKYGVQPVFKAGVHLGKVIVAEVGLIKREIAYHGDVLNTTARIQSRCNELKQQLLVSDDLLHCLRPDDRIQSHPLGEELLKGKEQKVTIYGVTRERA